MRKTAVVDCMVDCMLSRREAVGVLPEVSRKERISLMESRPTLSEAGVCDADGVWLADMWSAVARPCRCE